MALAGFGVGHFQQLMIDHAPLLDAIAQAVHCGQLLIASADAFAFLAIKFQRRRECIVSYEKDDIPIRRNDFSVRVANDDSAEFAIEIDH